VLVVPTGTVVPETHRPLTILAAGSDGAAMEAWVDVLRTAFGGNVIRSVDLQHCSGKSLETADVIVMSMAAPGRGPQAQFGATADVLKECVHPVLFVPSPHGIVERSPS
jgi:hypothetical protein